jgi:hypothetical protein
MQALPEAFTYALVKSGPDVDAEDVELGDVTAVEVLIQWGTTVLRVEHLTPPRSFYVGEGGERGDRCDYHVPAEKLGIPRTPLVLADGGSVYLVVLPRARGTIEVPGQPARTLQAVAAQQATPYAEIVGAHQIVLPPGVKAVMEIGGLVFRVAAVPAGKPLEHGLFATSDLSSMLHVGLSLAAHAGMLGALAFFVPANGLLDEEGLSRDRQYLIQQYLSASAEREAEQREALPAETNDVREGGSGAPSAGEEGSLGDPTTRESKHRYGVAGPKDNPDVHISRQEAIRLAADFGIIGLLQTGAGGDPNTPTARWGRDDSLGRDARNALGNMWGDAIENAFGARGLGLSGMGEGSGGLGEGIGMGPIATIDHGGGNGSGNGFGPGNGMPGSHGRVPPAHVTTVPNPRFGEGTVNGHIPREVIQRIVRQNHGRFKLCYEQGLRRNPNLQGRVAVRFVISRDGAVADARNGDSDLPDVSVVQCVVAVYYSLSFPAPEAGIVTVNYPIAFSPAE